MKTTPSMVRRTVAPSGLIANSSLGFYPVARAAFQEFWASISRAAGSPGSGVAQRTARAIAAATASAAALPSEARLAPGAPTDRQKRATPPGAPAASLHRPRPGRGARGVAHGAIRPDAMVAHVQIEDDGARDVRHHGAGDGEAPGVLLEILHGAPDGLEAEGAASCQDDAVHHPPPL